MDEKALAERLLDIYDFSAEMQKYDRIGIYGAGMVGRFIYEYLKKNGLDGKVRCFYTTEAPSHDAGGVSVRKISKEEAEGCGIIILAAKRSIRKEMLRECDRLGIVNIKEIDVLDDRDYEYYSSISEAAYPLELKSWYKRATGKELNLDNPKTFNEKINWMKLYDRDDRKTRLTDKYLVRDYVKEKIGEEYLIPLLGVWDRFDDIDFDRLPDRFVLKCNHGSTWNVIVKDKTGLDKAEAKEKFDRWMATNYAFISGFEMHYGDIKPRIIAEEYIEDAGEEDIPDYKMIAFDGVVYYIWVDIDRTKDHKRLIYTKDWEKLPYEILYPTSSQINVSKPDRLEEMIRVGEVLSKGFPHVRVDVYSCRDRIYFGEMTFSSGSGQERFTPESFGEELGGYFRLPKG